MILSLDPRKAVGPIIFGMHRDAVRAVLGGFSGEFMKTSLSKAPTDDFRSHHLHVFYDPTFSCIGVEVFRPAIVLVNGRNVVGEPYSSVMSWLSVVEPDVTLLDSVVQSKVFGLALYAPDADDEPNSLIESVYFRSAGE